VGTWAKAALAMYPNCPLCGVKMIALTTAQAKMTQSYPNHISRDHILPRSRGGTLVSEKCKPMGNHRIMCQSCNQKLCDCCHCPAILACVLACGDYAKVYRGWRLGIVRMGIAAQDFAKRQSWMWQNERRKDNG
jgi:hypothetical protein